MTSGRERTVVLGRYRVLRPIARGGMGVIYLARVEGAAGFSRPVAVKRVIPDRAGDASTLKLFVREARIMSQLTHPNIVNVIDFGEEDGDYIMILEYVRGYNLGAWHRYVLDQGHNIQIDHCVHIIASVLDALDYAHTFKRNDGTATPVIHRDVSPANVLLDTRGNTKLLDFGIARIEGGGEYRTRDGTLKGKLPFTAPEVFSGKDPTERSDVYSAGVLLYMLLANENPFRGADAKMTIARVLSHVPAPPSSKNPLATPEMDDLVMKALSREPSDRFSSAAEFAAELRKLTRRPPFEVVTELGKALEKDFLGEMPDQLGLTRLEELDQATVLDEPVVEYEGALTDVTDTVVTPMKLSSGPPPTAGARASSTPWLVGVGVLAVAGLAGAVVWVGSKESKPAQVIVIQKESAPGPASPSASSLAVPAETGEAIAPPTAGPSVAPTPVPTPKAATAPSPGAAGSPPPAAGATSLTSAFRARQPLVQSCFSKHAASVEGAPQVTLRFSVDAAGQVIAAAVSPANLSATPLGACLLGVARGTKFPPQNAPVSFSIPITARKVQ